MSEKAESERDKITPAERSDHSPDPFGGGGWGVGENWQQTQKLIFSPQVTAEPEAAPTRAETPTAAQ
jgi:hypothetical protein